MYVDLDPLQQIGLWKKTNDEFSFRIIFHDSCVRERERFTVSVFLHVQARSLGHSPAVARVSDPWLDPLSGNVGGDGEIVRPILYRQRAPSPADGQPDYHADPDQDQSNRTLDPKTPFVREIR